jgi:hypothetical protein
MIVQMRLDSFDDVRTARERVRDLAYRAGIQDLDATMIVTAELGNNCVEHRDEAPGTLWICCQPGRLSLRLENCCGRRPTWCTRKPLALQEFRTGGYGLQIAQVLARRMTCRWVHGRVIVLAEFHEGRQPHFSISNSYSDWRHLMSLGREGNLRHAIEQSIFWNISSRLSAKMRQRFATQGSYIH